MTTNNSLIAIVDDDTQILSFFKEILSIWGFASISFSNPSIFLDEFNKDNELYSLVITDLSMSPINGFELAQKVKISNPDTPIIAITGYHAFYQKDKSFDRSNFTEVLNKPIDLDILQNKIKDILEGQL